MRYVCGNLRANNGHTQLAGPGLPDTNILATLIGTRRPRRLVPGFAGLNINARR